MKPTIGDTEIDEALWESRPVQQTEAVWEALAQRIEARLDVEPSAVEHDVTRPPVFSDPDSRVAAADGGRKRRLRTILYVASGGVAAAAAVLFGMQVNESVGPARDAAASPAYSVAPSRVGPAEQRAEQPASPAAMAAPEPVRDYPARESGNTDDLLERAMAQSPAPPTDPPRARPAHNASKNRGDRRPWFNQDAVLAAGRTIQENAQSCVEAPTTVTLRITLGTAGRPTSVEVLPSRDPREQRCIERIVRRTRFTPPPGQPVTFTLPIHLSPAAP